MSLKNPKRSLQLWPVIDNTDFLEQILFAIKNEIILL